MIIADIIGQFQINMAAACFHLSPNYFHTLFIKFFNYPHTYMMRLKMNEATTLIANSGLTMKEIAFRSGLLYDTYFSHTFKKYYNTTPGSFRKEHRNISMI